MKVTIDVNLKAPYSVRCQPTSEINLNRTLRHGVEPGFSTWKASVDAKTVHKGGEGKVHVLAV